MMKLIKYIWQDIMIYPKTEQEKFIRQCTVGCCGENVQVGLDKDFLYSMTVDTQRIWTAKSLSVETGLKCVLENILQKPYL